MRQFCSYKGVFFAAGFDFKNLVSDTSFWHVSRMSQHVLYGDATLGPDIPGVIRGDNGAAGGSQSENCIVYGTDMPTIPSHWRPMSGLTTRFSIFHVDSYHSKITAVEADYVFKILRAAFRGAYFYDFDSDLDFDKAVSLSLASCKRTLHAVGDSRVVPSHALKKRKTVPLVLSKSFEKKDFYDLTLTDSENDEAMEEEDPGASQVDKQPDPVITQDALGDVASETKPASQMLRALDAFVRSLIMNTTTRLVEIQQIQNLESWEMHRSFNVIHRLISTYEIVYHGTSLDSLDGITREGIRGLYSRRAAYGRGTYLTRSFDTACAWATRDPDGMKHIIVVRCQLGSIKQVGNDVAEHGFYGTADEENKTQYNTKEVKMLKYLIVGSDAQLVTEAIITIEDMDYLTTRKYREALSTAAASSKTAALNKPAKRVYDANEQQNVFMSLMKMMSSNTTSSASGSAAAGGASGCSSSVSGVPLQPAMPVRQILSGLADASQAYKDRLNSAQQVAKTIKLVKRKVPKTAKIPKAAKIPKTAKAAKIPKIPKAGMIVQAANIPANAPDSLHGKIPQLDVHPIDKGLQMKVQKLQKEVIGATERMNETVLERQVRKDKTLLARQAPLPPDNLDLPSFRDIKKQSVVVLNKLGKSHHYMEGLEGVVKLIVKECPESYGNHKIMIELLDRQFFSQIENDNKKNEERRKQTGHSRYGVNMKLHYFICKHSQLTVKDDEAGAAMPGTPDSPAMPRTPDSPSMPRTPDSPE